MALLKTLRLTGLAVLAVGVATAAATAQTTTLVTEVRAAIAKQDFAEGDRLVAAHRGAHGVTPLYLEAVSWLGRGSLAAGKLDQAERYAQQAYDLTATAVKGGRLDAEPRHATAIGAAIEVLSQAGARRGARSEAVSFLRAELTRWSGTSIVKRIQKNLNLLSLEGTAAPELDRSESVGPAVPSLASLKGKTVLLFFWAHWCGDCKAMAPTVAALQEKYGSQGLVVIGPTQRYGYVARGKDAPAAEETAYIDQVRQSAYGAVPGMPVPTSTANMERYGVSTTPTLVIVDKAGMVRLYNPGQMTTEALEPHVRKALGI
ncbi:MAG: TlpA family protein disulfide reductase [Armatimonadetes bacterium]|nr:TlpA family protein disulfide reductase [Armatimonadota bacterium]